MGMGGQGYAPVALHTRKTPGTHCIGSWVGPRAGLDGCGKSRHNRDSIHSDQYCSNYIMLAPLIIA
jgi:hypothetical protein